MNENIQYIGETLWPGQIGHFFIILSFISILFSIFSYWRDTKDPLTEPVRSWKFLGRVGFMTHALSVFGIIGILFYVMSQLMYEYSYVFDHCSDDLPMKYIFSAFWEGQEGSFLLWMFWHSICILRIHLEFLKMGIRNYPDYHPRGAVDDGVLFVLTLKPCLSYKLYILLYYNSI